MPKLIVNPGNNEITLSEGQNVLERLREEDIYIKSSCGGNGSCSDCKIKVCSGEDNLNSPSFEEVNLLGNVFHITKERLACQTVISGEVTIDVSNHDKDADQKQITEKTSKLFAKKNAQKNVKTKTRKREEVDQIINERKQMLDDRDVEREKQEGQWKEHWKNKEIDPSKPKRIGGGKRPKLFRYDEDEENEDQ